MIWNASELSPAQKQTLETLLGRPIRESESVSLRTFESAKLSLERKQELAEKLRAYFAEVDASRKTIPEDEAEEILSEAMRSVRPGFRLHR
jgi:hypothetical protein